MEQYAINGGNPLVGEVEIGGAKNAALPILAAHPDLRRQRHQELCRIAAENRALAIREQVNHLRSLGDCFITEPPNAKKLQKRANPENPVDKNGRMKRKKRFGRSIKNRCPGYLQAKAKQLFESTGGMYVEVPILYRASQYDHTSDSYIPKKLSQRMYHLAYGTNPNGKVQRHSC